MREQRCGSAIHFVAWIHKESPVRSFQDGLPKREKKREKGTMIVWIRRSVRGKGCALRVLPKRILLRDSARSLFRHVRATTFTDDDDDEDDEDYPLFHGRTSPRTSLFQECELLWKRSYKEIAVSLPITRKVARNLMLLILGETLLILEESLLIRQESNIIKKRTCKK